MVEIEFTAKLEIETPRRKRRPAPLMTVEYGDPLARAILSKWPKHNGDFRRIVLHRWRAACARGVTLPEAVKAIFAGYQKPFGAMRDHVIKRTPLRVRPKK